MKTRTAAVAAGLALAAAAVAFSAGPALADRDMSVGDPPVVDTNGTRVTGGEG